MDINGTGVDGLDSLNVLERDLLSLFGGDGEDVHL